MKVAVVGDIHGAWHAMYAACARWERRTGERVEALLQVGDLGVFPDLTRLDRATRRAAEAGSAALEFLDYLRPAGTPVPVPTYFVAGNHEDFDFLVPRRNRAIDPAGRIVQVAAGKVWRLGEGADAFTVAGIGGIEPEGVGPGKWRQHVGRRYVDPDDVERMLALAPGACDVLLAHDAPYGRGLVDKAGTGSRSVLRVIEHLRPKAFFHGHYDRPPPEARIGPTWCVPANTPQSVLPGDGGFAVLDSATWRLRKVEAWEPFETAELDLADAEGTVLA